MGSCRGLLLLQCGLGKSSNKPHYFKMWYGPVLPYVEVYAFDANSVNVILVIENVCCFWLVDHHS